MFADGPRWPGNRLAIFILFAAVTKRTGDGSLYGANGDGPMVAFGALLVTTVVVWLHGRVTSSDSNPLLAQCAAELLRADATAQTAVHVTMGARVTHGFRTELLSAMHRAHVPTLLLRRFDVQLFNPNQYVLPDAYVVAARDLSDLADHLDTVNVTGVSWRPEAKFVVTLETPVERAAERELKPVYRRFWTSHVFRSALLVPPMDGRDRGTTVHALVWSPFTRKCGQYHEPMVVDTCTANGTRWRDGNGLFANRIPATFNGDCTVKIAAFNWPPLTVLSNHTPRTMVRGMDVEVIKLMGRIGRVKLELTEVENDQRWGVMAANGSWNGGLGKLSEHRADFLIGGAILTVERMKRFNSVASRQVIRFPLYTPLPRKLPYWRNMLYVFTVDFWLTVFAVFATTAGLLWLSGVGVPTERRAFADPGHCLAISWAILCSVAGGRPPASVASKTVYLSWVVFAFHIGAVYTAMQLMYLYEPKFERPMRTIDDVKKSGLLVCSVPTFIPIARHMAAENFNLTEYTPCTDMTASADRLLWRKDIIVLDPEDHFEALITSSLNKVNKLDEVVIVHNIGIYMQKGNPYRAILTRAQIVAYESGLHGKWRRTASPPVRSSGNDKDIKVKRLNMDELQGAFIIFMCGLCAGLAAFLSERFLGSN